jgi:hypothetical protein
MVRNLSPQDPESEGSMFRNLKTRATVDYVDGGLWIVCGCGQHVVELKMGKPWPEIVAEMTRHECPEDARKKR